MKIYFWIAVFFIADALATPPSACDPRSAELGTALASSQGTLAPDSLAWVKSQFLKSDSDWESLNEAQKKRVIGMLSPVKPAPQGRVSGKKTVVTEEMKAKKRDEIMKSDPSLNSQQIEARVASYVDDLDFENLSAEILKRQGYHVMQNPDEVKGLSYLKAKKAEGISDKRRPDYFILSEGHIEQGKIFDHYMSRGNLDMTVRGILNKTEKVDWNGQVDSQTHRIVVNLMLNQEFKLGRFDPAKLREALRNSPRNSNLEEVIIIHGRASEKIIVERVFP
ncbi:MAG: hypothetical protein A4S09_16605 [Proteobacteria bacterium SG_bin7]|nr:MAG: hypothetical protein A4S09_16605 [Proteobacteria bacterium SG_bin7]